MDLIEATLPVPVLYIRDNAADTGSEPNATATVAWESLDVWVRQSADGITVGEPILGGQPSVVYVRITKRGTRLRTTLLSRRPLKTRRAAKERNFGGPSCAMIARAADFYGPETPNGPPNVFVFEPFAKNQQASWLANDSVPHSYTYTPDAARSLVTLAENEFAWNQTWHVATTPNPPTGKEFMAMAAKELGVDPRYRVLSRPTVKNDNQGSV